jgi:2-hydroxychromene-2-carboxylate isomerase
MSKLRDRAEREIGPRVIVAASTVTAPARATAAARRLAGRSGRLELYFGFDEPTSAYAVIDLAKRLEGRKVTFDLLPVVDRGIKDDSALERKLKYRITDGRRLGKRIGLTLSRSEPIDPQQTAFLAAWVAGAPRGSALTRFCSEACRRIWFESDGPIDERRYEELWRECFGSAPVSDIAAVRANEKKMTSRGPYETPAAWIGGRWFFAHDRSAQIADWLDELGWTVKR